MPRASDHTVERSAVTPQARRGDLPASRLVVLALVRIVARRAQQLAAALLKTGRLAETVHGADDFEFPVPAGGRRMVEVQLEIA
jgi:hypothetical protein